MKIKECNFCINETLTGQPSNGTCSLLPEYYNNGLDYRFIDCEAISITKCPYKAYLKKLIDKDELNKQIKIIADEIYKRNLPKEQKDE